VTPIITGPAEVVGNAWEELHDATEQVGFFLADFVEADGAFRILDWRLVGAHEEFDEAGFHVTLGGEVQTEVIQWAFSTGRCLIEAHSHGPRWPAEFSRTDVLGLDEWVPHVRWRLRGRPYGALVVGGTDFDGLAWVDTSTDPVQVSRLVAGSLDLAATCRTLPKIRLTRAANE
jgi:hypothetical protein